MKKVTASESNIRLDSYLACSLGLSRSSLEKYFREGLISCNGKPLKPSYKTVEGEVYLVGDLAKKEVNISPYKVDLDILYEDDALLIVNKPSGMVVHPAAGHHDDTLVNALVAGGHSLSNMGDENRLGIVHRIDKDTSGLLVVCKTNEAHQNIALQFKNKKDTLREYLAICEGHIPNRFGKIDAPIKRDPNNRLKMAVLEGGKEAITHFEVLEYLKDATLLKLRLETGRTHQIRVHLAYIGYPVLNDPLYSKNKATSFGQYLHASSLGFIHPKTKERLEFRVDLPIEFKEKLEELR